ncbi:hypothetical protein NQZ79_g704 [Umbelopsis isabellina]|nr:hypothetical protein NQZ79_g704 [Umbelopsis isabellina]
MLQSIKDYTKRHRRGLLVTATIVGGGIFAGQYARNKIQELQDRAASERMAKENLKRRFEQNQNDCTFTVMSLLPTLSEQIFEDMAVEELWTKLQQLRREQKQKQEQKQREIEEAEAKAKEEEAAKAQEQVAVEEAGATESTAEDQKDKETNVTTASEEKKDGEEIKEEAAEPNPEIIKDEPESLVEEKASYPLNQEPPKLAAALNENIIDSSIGSLANSTLSEGSELSNSQNLTTSQEDKFTEQKSKYALWEEIKVKSKITRLYMIRVTPHTKSGVLGFTRSLTSIYCLSLLSMLTHTQLNLLGRFTYVSSISSLNRSEPTIRIERSGSESRDTFLDIDAEGKFLSVSWWLLHRGWKKLAQRVESAVQEVFGRLFSSTQLKHATNYEETLRMIKRVRNLVEYDSDSHHPHNFSPYIIPQNNDDEVEVLVQAGYSTSTDAAVDALKNQKLRRLLDETSDFVESDDFHKVLEACLEELFAMFYYNTFSKPFERENNVLGEPKIEEINNNYLRPTAGDKKVTIANLLPPVSRQSHLIINSNEYLNALSYVKELQAFSAIIYTQYDIAQEA